MKNTLVFYKRICKIVLASILFFSASNTIVFANDSADAYFTVSFVNEDGSAFTIDGGSVDEKIENGQLAFDPLEGIEEAKKPSKDSDENYQYSFLAWSLDGINSFDFTSQITSDISLRPIFSSIEKVISNGNDPNEKVEQEKDEGQVTERSVEEDGTIYYDVTFIYYIGSATETTSLLQQIVANQDAIAPANSQVGRDGYRFTGWDTDYTNVTEDLIVTANYEPLESYNISITYEYLNGSMASDGVFYTVEVGKDFNKTVTSPIIEGFTASELSVVLNFDSSQKDDIEKTIIYSGSEKDYTINHYLEELDGSYSLLESEVRSSQVGLETTAASKDIAGMTSQSFNNVIIPQNGVVVIDIYYNLNSYVLSFDTKGGTVINSQSYKYQEPIDPIVDPVKYGYVFNGWSNPITTMPANDLELVVNDWSSESTASYKVVYMQQKVDLSGYEFKETIVENGNVGDEASYSILSYPGFELNTIATDELKPLIKTDNSTVKTVYYDRVIYTIDFKIKSNDAWTKVITISEPYETFVGDQYPTTYNGDTYNWATTPNGNTYYISLANMPAESFTLYGKLYNLDVNVNYWIQNIDDLNEYTLYTTYLIPKGFSYTIEDQIPIEGFTYESGANPGSSIGNEGNVYYSRNKYNIHFANVKDIVDDEYYYEEVLNQISVLPENRPDGIDSDYTFAGWYLDENLADGSEFDWNINMPATNLILYAKWLAPSYDVIIHDNENNIISTSSHIKYSEISVPEDVALDGYTFAGWYKDENRSQKLISGEKLIKTTHLYPKFNLIPTYYNYTVRYVDDGNEIAPSINLTAIRDTTVSIEAISVSNYTSLLEVFNVVIYENNQIVDVEYDPLNSYQYSVKFVDENNDTIASTINSQTNKLQLNFFAKSISGYRLLSDYVMIVTPENRELVFEYQLITDVPYTVIHNYYRGDILVTSFEENLEGSLGSTVYANEISKEGYDLQTHGLALMGVVNASGSLTINLTYKKRMYKIDWLNYDGSLLQTSNEFYGTLPSYEGETPLRSSDSEYNYTFSNFTPQIEKVSDDATYIAKYDRALKLELNGFDLIYDSDDHYIVVNVKQGVNIEYSVGNSSSFTFSEPSFNDLVNTDVYVKVSEVDSISTIKHVRAIIRAKPITITADSASKTYDGNPLSKDTYSQMGLISGERSNKC